MFKIFLFTISLFCIVHGGKLDRLFSHSGRHIEKRSSYLSQVCQQVKKEEFVDTSTLINSVSNSNYWPEKLETVRCTKEDVEAPEKSGLICKTKTRKIDVIEWKNGIPVDSHTVYVNSDCVAYIRKY